MNAAAQYGRSHWSEVYMEEGGKKKEEMGVIYYQQ